MRKTTIDLFTSNLSEIEVVYRNKQRNSEMPKISSSKDAESIFRSIWTHRIGWVEEFYALFLNRSNKVLGWAKISQGGQNGTVADPKVIFQVALKANASHIILAHNHPSGNLEPSAADISLTQKMKDAGHFLDLPVLDHLILNTEEYYSFADDGKL
jgi:DNA repair protein RadC